MDRRRTRKPALGFNLVSWGADTNVKSAPWFEALENIKALGVGRVTIVCYRFLDADSGTITEKSAFGLASGPSASLISAVAEQARAYDFDVGLNPFLEVDNPDGIGRVWRGSVAFNRQCLSDFFSAYERYIGELAMIAQRVRAARLYIGSELSELTKDAEARSHWVRLIANIRMALGQESSCRLSYAANYDEFAQIPFWESLDDIGVDAYFPLASTRQSKGAARPREDVLVRGWSRNLRRLKSFSNRLRKPLTISEWGTVPLDLTSAKPWDWQPSQIPNSEEQLSAYRTLLRSIRAEGYWLRACDLWHWRMPGNEGSAYGIDKASDAAGYIRRYATMDE